MRYATFLWSAEARRRRRERGISEEAGEIVVERGSIIEDTHRAGRTLPTRIYLDFIEGRPVHVVVAYDEASALGVVVTVYEPTPDRWEPGFRERRRQ